MSRVFGGTASGFGAPARVGRRIGRGLLGAALMLALAASAPAAPPDDGTRVLDQLVPKIAPFTAGVPKPEIVVVPAPQPASPAAAPAQSAAKRPMPGQPAKKIATKPKPPARKVAAAAKKPPDSKKPAAALKAGQPAKQLAAAAPKAASFTVGRADGRSIHPAAPAGRTAILAPGAAPSAEAAPPAERPAVVAAGSDLPAATAFVAKFLDDAFRIARLRGASSLQRRAQLADLFGGKLDIGRMAGYTTADELSNASPEVQRRFPTVLVSYLVETYYPRLELASDPSVTVKTAPGGVQPDGTAVVWTTFAKAGWGSQSVKWVLASESGGFKIVDIYSAGASLVQMERDTFLSVMRDGGVPELMAKLDARTKQLAAAATN